MVVCAVLMNTAKYGIMPGEGGDEDVLIINNQYLLSGDMDSHHKRVGWLK